MSVELSLCWTFWNLGMIEVPGLFWHIKHSLSLHGTENDQTIELPGQILAKSNSLHIDPDTLRACVYRLQLGQHLFLGTLRKDPFSWKGYIAHSKHIHKGSWENLTKKATRETNASRTHTANCLENCLRLENTENVVKLLPKSSINVKSDFI